MLFRSVSQSRYQLANWTKQSIENADAIVTISESSKKDILDNYSVSEKQVTVSYPGHSDAYKPVSDQKLINRVKEKYQISGDYVLFLGTVQPRKNLKRLIEAFSKIAKENDNKNLSLVVVGKIHGIGRQAWMFEEIVDLPKKLGIEKQVVFTDYVSDEDAVLLMNGARAYLLPSLWEGFGIPAVDAMCCGVPCVVSNLSSLPEVVGDAGLLVDPRSIEQIENAIRRITTDEKLHSSLSKSSLEQCKKFSWKKMATEVLKVM